MVKEFDAVPSLMGRRDSTFRSMVSRLACKGGRVMSRVE